MTPRDPDYETAVRRIFAGQGLMATFGAELLRIAPGAAEIAAPIRPEVCQQHGYAHAAVAWSLGDTAAGCAAQSLLAPGDGVLTVEMKINLLAPARGDRLVARGRVERAGRSLTVVGAEVVVQEGGRETVVALMLGTMMRMEGMTGG